MLHNRCIGARREHAGADRRSADRTYRAGGSNARFYISPSDGAWERSKMRIECIVHSSTPTLCDRRLNPLYRRIIATENIGRVGLRMAADPTKCTADRPSDLFIAEKIARFPAHRCFR